MQEAVEMPAAEASPISDARLQQAYDYWRRKSADQAMPRRADIDPTEIPRLLPYVLLVDVLESGRYRYRLIGTENANAHGFDATGRYLDEVLPGPEYKAHVLGLYDTCVRERRPVYSESLFFPPGYTVAERHTKVLFMPLTREGMTVSDVFVLQVFLYINWNTRNRHFVESRPYKEIVHELL